MLFIALAIAMAAGGPGQAVSYKQAPPPVVAAISERLRQSIVAKEIAGAVTVVATPEGIIHLDAAGSASLAPARPMMTDAIFWIASMSKPILATLILMLQEEGLLSVDDPVEKYLPQFKELKTVDGKPAQVTIRHLLTHTSGMGEITGDQARNCRTLAEVIPLYLAKPVSFTPGSKWVYCQSGINTAGRIAEVITGEPLENLMKRRLFDPLGMKDTTFYLTQEQLPRLARSYWRTDRGELEPAAIGFLNGKSPTNLDRFPAPNGGLFSTAADYARFCRMILRGGELDGRRYLKPETVKLMTTIQTGSLKTGFTPGNGWGLGWCVVREPQGITVMLSPGTFGHGGVYGTQAWIDPGKKRVYILLVQRANFPNSDASEVRRGFQEAASKALGDSASSSLERNGSVKRGNPVIDGWYADPEAAIFGKEYWIYPTYSAPYDKQVFFDAFSSSDLVHWTKHPRILDTSAVKWARRALWAPAIVEKDGKYYFFFSANDIQERQKTVGGIGVAVADHPAGPFKDYLDKPLIGAYHHGAQPIDQFVFKDKDGQYYIIYGGHGHCNIARLSSDFTGLVPLVPGSDTVFKEVTPRGYVEGPLLFLRNGRYYLMWSEGGWTGPNYAVAYGISDSLLGPYQRVQKVLSQDPAVATGAGHHSLFHLEKSDQWYIVYHRRPLGDRNPNHRVVCIDRMEFDASGMIKPIVITHEGVGPKRLD